MSHWAGTVQIRKESGSRIRKWEEIWLKMTVNDGERERAAVIRCSSDGKCTVFKMGGSTYTWLTFLNLHVTQLICRNAQWSLAQCKQIKQTRNVCWLSITSHKTHRTASTDSSFRYKKRTVHVSTQVLNATVQPVAFTISTSIQQHKAQNQQQ